MVAAVTRNRNDRETTYEGLGIPVFGIPDGRGGAAQYTENTSDEPPRSTPEIGKSRLERWAFWGGLQRRTVEISSEACDLSEVRSSMHQLGAKGVWERTECLSITQPGQRDDE